MLEGKNVIHNPTICITKKIWRWFLQNFDPWSHKINANNQFYNFFHTWRCHFDQFDIPVYFIYNKIYIVWRVLILVFTKIFLKNHFSSFLCSKIPFWCLVIPFTMTKKEFKFCFLIYFQVVEDIILQKKTKKQKKNNIIL